jgi:hypothetical protein
MIDRHLIVLNIFTFQLFTATKYVFLWLDFSSMPKIICLAKAVKRALISALVSPHNKNINMFDSWQNHRLTTMETLAWYTTTLTT